MWHVIHMWYTCHYEGYGGSDWSIFIFTFIDRKLNCYSKPHPRLVEHPVRSIWFFYFFFSFLSISALGNSARANAFWCIFPRLSVRKHKNRAVKIPQIAIFKGEAEGRYADLDPKTRYDCLEKCCHTRTLTCITRMRQKTMELSMK